MKWHILCTVLFSFLCRSTHVLLKAIKNYSFSRNVLYLSHAFGSNDTKTLASSAMQSLNCSGLSPPSTISGIRSEKEPQDFPTEMFPPGFFVVHDTARRRQHKEPAQTIHTRVNIRDNGYSYTALAASQWTGTSAHPLYKRMNYCPSGSGPSGILCSRY